MLHAATVVRTLAGAACAVLLASCATQQDEPVTTQDDPAPQVEVVDRSVEDESADEKNAGEDPASEEDDAGEAFDASAPVVDLVTESGIAVTAPEGFLDTPEFATVEAELSALVSAGHSVSVRMVDLETGRSITYNADVERYPASSIKALFCASLMEAHGGAAGMSQTVASCLINSSNEAYEALIDTFGLSTLCQWLTDHGAPNAVDEARTHFYPNISANELANAWTEIWRFGTSGEPGSGELVSYLSQTSPTPIGDTLRGEREVWSKAGWYPADANQLTSANDAGVVFSDDGAYVLVVMSDLSADLDGLVPLVTALDAAHDAMV